jgi:hypothetical protein
MAIVTTVVRTEAETREILTTACMIADDYEAQGARWGETFRAAVRLLAGTPVVIPDAAGPASPPIDLSALRGVPR